MPVPGGNIISTVGFFLGTPLAPLLYEDGLLEGERKIWSEEEELLKLEKYSKGRLLYKKEFQ